MRVEGVLLENMKEVMLVVRMQEVEVKEGFGAIGAGDGKDAVVNAERDEGVEMVGMGCAKGTGEGSGEDAGERVGDVDGPTDEDSGGQASEGDGKACDAGGGHAGDGMKAFGREIADGEGAMMGVEYEDAVAVAMG